MTKLNLPAARVIALAALAGVIAGGIAVYVSGGLSGNNGADVAGGSAADTACAANADRAKALAAKATGDVAAVLPADPPQSLSTLAFNGPDAKPMTVAGFAGRTVLLNLWATWCAPCRAEMPSLDALEQEKGGDGFEVVTVNVDTGDDTKPKSFLEETNVNALGYYRDPSMGVFNDLKKRGLVLGLPATLLIGPDGCLLAHMNGPAEWAGDDAKTFIDAALTTTP